MFETMGRCPIWLVGMMGAGKSAVGPLLASSLGRRFVDTDVEIERSAGMAVSQIFSVEGERAFRDRERQLIEDLSGGGDVVALGGGAIAQPGDVFGEATWAPGEGAVAIVMDQVVQP